MGPQCERVAAGVTHTPALVSWRSGVEQEVDFILLCGDLFDENKPSHATLYKAMELIRSCALRIAVRTDCNLLSSAPPGHLPFPEGRPFASCFVDEPLVRRRACASRGPRGATILVCVDKPVCRHQRDVGSCMGGHLPKHPVNKGRLRHCGRSARGGAHPRKHLPGRQRVSHMPVCDAMSLPALPCI